MLLLLVPSDVFSPRKPDEHFAEEAAAAAELGYSVAVVDHDALTGTDADPARVDEAVRRVPADHGDEAVYRGWMLTSAQYEGFAAALGRRGVRLRTDAAAYRKAHELPGWYDTLRDLTPESVWGDTIAALCARLGDGRAVVRDHVKSEKHHWDEAMYVPDVTDVAVVEKVTERFLDLRGDWLDGGVVLRRFEPFEPPELRSWWVGGRLALVSAHPDTPDTEVLPVDLPGLAAAVERLDVPFVTVDLARAAGGRWRVVEVGDGQVSDRPRSLAAGELVRAVLGG